jgi:LPXTG-motif cell wall-anchored protein
MQHRFKALRNISVTVAGLGLFISASAVPAKASLSDRMTVVTINEKMIAGNKVLEPGTYVWKLLNTNTDLHTVQIFDKDQTHIEETILAVPNYRLTPTGHTSFAFWETPPGVPKAIRAWFYPGDNMGQEFTYPKKLVAQLAAAVPVPLPTAYKDTTTEPAAQPAAAPEPQPQPAAAAPAVEPTPEPSPQPAQDATPARAPQENAAPALPHTASNTPLIGLIGITFLGLTGLLSVKARQS